MEALVDYTADMEGVNCQLSIIYDPQLAIIQNNSLNFKVDSRNEELVLVDEEQREQKAKITFIFRILSYAVLVVFLLSLPHKMIGVELVVSCQIAYFSYVLYANPTYFSSAIPNLILVTGYRTLFYREEYG